MRAGEAACTPDLSQRLAEAEATIQALLSGQIDAVVDPKSSSPVLLSKAQGALRDSEERYRRIVETANEGIWTLDTEAKVTFANPRFSEMLGYPAGELLGKPMQTLLPQAAKDRPAARIENARQGFSEENEVWILRKDGSELWALIKTSPIHDSDASFVGILCMMTDRTLYKRAEEALRKSEEQYRQIVETTSDGILKLDANAAIVFVNRRFAEMLGYDPAEMIGKSLFVFKSAAAKGIAAAGMEKRLLGMKEAVDTTFLHKNGTDIPVNLAGTLLLDAEGRHIGNLAMIRDVTEQRKLQSQLMVSDRMASVGTLAAGVAHEINNPLAAVIANLDFLAESLGQAAARASSAPCPKADEAFLLEELRVPLAEAREAAQQVRFIVRDLKILSRSPATERTGPVDVKAVLESSLRMAWNEIRHRAQLVKEYGLVPRVEVNQARLGQVFLNLIVNAAQALPEGRADHNEIRVSTRLEGGRVVIEVSDTGPGIPPEIIGRIFDAFFTTKAVGVGTGLGLAISQRIVTDMGGELTVESKLGKGTIFRVALPAAHHEESPAAAPQGPAMTAAVRRGKVLIVDDEKLVLGVLKRILSKEHDVVALAAAKDALALCLAGEKFDVIFCDLMMPDMTGMDLHRELSAAAPDQAGKMIFLTGGAFSVEARTFLSEIPKEHVEKPFDPANLRAIVQRHLR
jgi:PAS domain S-box-containing protein